MSKETGALAQIHRQIMWNRLIAVVEEASAARPALAWASRSALGDDAVIEMGGSFRL